MSDLLIARVVRIGAGAVMGLVGLVAVTTTPAAAISLTECQDLGKNANVAVDLVGNPILAEQPDGSFAGPVDVRVYCKLGGSDLGLIPGSTVTISTTVPNATINGVNPLTLTLATGQATVTMRSTDPKLAAGQWSATVGESKVSVTGVADTSLLNIRGLPTISDSTAIYAQTPELGSLALFGAGAAGMAGYAMMRLRASRGRRARRPRASALGTRRGQGWP